MLPSKCREQEKKTRLVILFSASALLDPHSFLQSTSISFTERLAPAIPHQSPFASHSDARNANDSRVSELESDQMEALARVLSGD